MRPCARRNGAEGSAGQTRSDEGRGGCCRSPAVACNSAAVSAPGSAASATKRRSGVLRNRARLLRARPSVCTRSGPSATARSGACTRSKVYHHPNLGKNRLIWLRDYETVQAEICSLALSARRYLSVARVWVRGARHRAADFPDRVTGPRTNGGILGGLAC